ncbi:MAG: universal stress protein [Deltaproteobacteria bacterium]|nr:universal stress protein [Deltaproteobacteria bacterium]
MASDLSEPADEAIRQADQQARATGARLVICHVISSPLHLDPLFSELSPQLVMLMPKLRERLGIELTARVASLTGRAEGDFDLHLEEGLPHARVIALSERLGAALLVIGSSGATGLKRALLGGVAEQIVRHAHGPIMIARPGRRSGHILAATDFSDAALPAVRAGAEQAKQRGGDLTVLNSIYLPPALFVDPLAGGFVAGVTPEQRERLRALSLRHLEEALDKVACRGHSVVAEELAQTAIVRHAEELQAELVVVGSHGRTGLKRLLLGSTAEAVVKGAPCSVMVVRLHEAHW